MSDLELQDNASVISHSFKSRVILGQAETPKIIGFLLKNKVAKNEEQAGYILLGVIVLIFAAAIAVYIIAKPSPEIPYEQSPHMYYGA